jgi:hypothetical protein
LTQISAAPLPAVISINTPMKPDEVGVFIALSARSSGVRNGIHFK